METHDVRKRFTPEQKAVLHELDQLLSSTFVDRAILLLPSEKLSGERCLEDEHNLLLASVFLSLLHEKKYEALAVRVKSSFGRPSAIDMLLAQSVIRGTQS